MTEGFMSENLKYVPDNTNHPLLSKLESKLSGPKAEWTSVTKVYRVLLV